MNKILHLGTLVAALSIGCAANSAVVEPAVDQKDPALCAEVSLESGTYVSRINGKEEKYTVTMGGKDVNSLVCKLVLHSKSKFGQRNEYVLYDTSCNNKVDSVESAFLRLSYSREFLVKTGYVELFDSLLEQAQAYVCPKNNAEFVFIGKEFEEIRRSYTK